MIVTAGKKREEEVGSSSRSHRGSKKEK